MWGRILRVVLIAGACVWLLTGVVLLSLLLGHEQGQSGGASLLALVLPPTPTPTSTETATPTPSATSTPTWTPSSTATPTETSTPTSTPTWTPTNTPVPTATTVPSATPRPTVTPVPPPPRTATQVPRPAVAPAAPKCSTEVNSRVSIDPWSSRGWKWRTTQGYWLRITLTVYGGDGKVSVRFYDSGGTKLGEKSVASRGVVEYTAPYADEFKWDVYNSFWSTVKTVEVLAEECWW